MHGRTSQELPPRSLGVLSKAVLVAMTGPNGGLTTVNHHQRHLSISDPDVHFIDEPQTGNMFYNFQKNLFFLMINYMPTLFYIKCNYF